MDEEGWWRQRNNPTMMKRQYYAYCPQIGGDFVHKSRPSGLCIYVKLNTKSLTVDITIIALGID